MNGLAPVGDNADNDLCKRSISPSEANQGKREGVLFHPSGPHVADFLRLHSCEMFSVGAQQSAQDLWD